MNARVELGIEEIAIPTSVLGLYYVVWDRAGIYVHSQVELFVTLLSRMDNRWSRQAAYYNLLDSAVYYRDLQDFVLCDPFTVVTKGGKVVFKLKDEKTIALITERLLTQ